MLEAMRASTWLSPWLCAWLWVSAVCASPFSVYWNVPSHQCAKYDVYINVSQYGLLQNAGDAFYGDKVTIQYAPGAFPYLDKGGQPVRGGIPQNGSLTTHVQDFINKLNTLVPLDFAGAAVLDFEEYYPSYQLSPPKYREASRAWVRAQHPTWSPQQVEEYAEESFNASAKDFFQSLLWVGRELRPGGLWGYYHYPYCHNYHPGDKQCRAKTQQMNQELSWLFEGSAALYPSLYIMRGVGFSPHARSQHARLNLLEALVVRRRVNSTVPVLPYLWYRYHDTSTLLSPVDMVTTMGMARLAGAEGAVVWGASADMATEKLCRSLKSYAEEKVGPLVRYLTHLPRAKLRRLLASRARLKRAVRVALRGVKRGKGRRQVPDMCDNNLAGSHNCVG